MEQKQILDPEVSPTPAEQPQEIRRLVCKRCGCVIDCGLCGWECPLDNMLASERNRDDMEIRVYVFVRAEQLLAGVVPHAPQEKTKT